MLRRDHAQSRSQCLGESWLLDTRPLALGERVMAKPMQIFAKTLSGKPSRLTLRPQDTIDNTKVKIHDKLGIPADHQCLTGAGKQLVNERTVSEYAIRKKGGQTRNDLTFGFGSMRRDAELF